ncbi:MAG: DNA glycosylase [Verrucomicrobiota bacterium]
MELVPLPDVLIDLELTFGSGQAFHWVREGAGWIGAIESQPAYLEQRGTRVFVNPEAQAAAERYLALDHPLDAVYASFPNDGALQESLDFCRGMRILRQPRWEAVATFITSSMKQVPHIAKISHTLRTRYGRRLALKERVLYAYPEPGVMAGLEESDLRACALGYRAKNLLGAARKVASGEVSLEEVAGLPDEQARKLLCELPGVGEKVANCALLFGFERLRAFPVDVWIERVIKAKYFPRKKTVTAAQIREFCAKYFGPYGGYAQQYLFHHARLTWDNRRSKTPSSKKGAGKSA